MAAPTYRDRGLIVVTFDEGSDSAACCGEVSGLCPDHPNVPLPGKNGPGGGRIGAVLLSPLIRPGTVSTVDRRGARRLPREHRRAEHGSASAELHEAAAQLTTNQAGLIAVGEPTIEQGLDKALTKAARVVKRTVEATTDEIASELQEALKS